LNEVFSVQVPTDFSKLPNSAPQVSNKVIHLSTVADETHTYTVGIPYDMQLDSYYVSEWGCSDGPVPEWLQFMNETVSQGIKFRVSPGSENVGEEYEVFYKLSDANNNPMSETYKFTLEVVEQDGFEEK